VECRCAAYPTAVCDDRNVTRAAAFLDLDKTIIAGSSSLAFRQPLRRHGLIDRRTMLRGAYAHFMLMFAGADEAFMATLRDRLTALCTGWDVATVRSIIAETLHDVVRPMVYAEAAAIIAGHRAEGRAVVLLSASGEEMVAPIAELVGADDFVASRMSVVDGRYSGRIEFYCYGVHKADAARDIARDRGLELSSCYAYSDSITDLPLLETVGHPVAVNPDRALRREAERRGWPVLTFAHPVPLRTRLRSAPATRTALVAALSAVVLAGVLVGTGWLGRRRR
jgi:HAD superfamily hydrolase (TIGR01490 family)